jgi:hypothetical protein
MFYWRDRNAEVDFVVRAGKAVTVIEVKSGRVRDAFPGLSAFGGAVPRARKLVIGAGGVPVEEFLRRTTLHWSHNEVRRVRGGRWPWMSRNS